MAKREAVKLLRAKISELEKRVAHCLKTSRVWRERYKAVKAK